MTTADSLLKEKKKKRKDEFLWLSHYILTELIAEIKRCGKKYFMCYLMQHVVVVYLLDIDVSAH